MAAPIPLGDIIEQGLACMDAGASIVHTHLPVHNVEAAIASEQYDSIFQAWIDHDANALAMPVRRASQPSTPSSTVAAPAAPATIHPALGSVGSPMNPATIATRNARTIVIWLAGPNRGNGWCARADRRASSTIAANTTLALTMNAADTEAGL